MSYAHYWTRIFELDRDSFAKFAEDVYLIISRAEAMGLRLAGPNGKGSPVLGPDSVAFNGSATCGHRYRDLGHPFASATATGVEEVEPPYDAKADPWVGLGPFLETRVCGGVCAGEPFVVDRKYMVRDWERSEANGRYSCSCVTHFKPYDLVVTAVLIRLKEHLRDAITISTENPHNGFEDAMRFCRELFGWPSYFEIEKPRAEVLQ